MYKVSHVLHCEPCTIQQAMQYSEPSYICATTKLPFLCFCLAMYLNKFFKVSATYLFGTQSLKKAK